MHKSVKERIYADADACARKNGLDSHRVRRIFLKLSRSDPLFWWMYFDQAIASVGPQRALGIFSNTNIKKLCRRSYLFNDLNDSVSLFYTLSELAQVIEAFVVHSKANKVCLVKTGYSEELFGPSLWFHSWLNFLYPTATKSGKLFSSVRPKIGALRPVDRKLLIAKREKLFNVKVQLLNQLAQILKKNDDSKLWEKCLKIFVDNLSANDIDLLLRADRFTDRVRLGVKGPLFVLSVRLDCCPQNLTLEELIEHFPTGLSAGGLTEMLHLIGHCEKEFTIGTKARTKLSFLSLPDDFSWSSYFKSVGKPWQQQLDKALDEFDELQTQETPFWEEYCKRVNEVLQNDFYEDVRIKTKVKRKHKDKFVASVKGFSDWQRIQLETTGQLSPLQISAIGTNARKKKKDVVTPRISCDAKKNAEKISVISALLSHHKFSETESKEGLNFSPVKQEQLGKTLGWTQYKVCRVIQRSFPPGFWKRYQQVCKADALMGFLQKLDDESIDIQSIHYRPSHPIEREEKEARKYE